MRRTPSRKKRLPAWSRSCGWKWLANAKNLQDAEARIYFDNYQLIANGVKFLAQHYKINLVLRYNSEDMDLEKGESVIRGVMKNIVYHDKALDMTQGVMQYLDKTMNQQARGGNTTAKLGWV